MAEQEGSWLGVLARPRMVIALQDNDHSSPRARPFGLSVHGDQTSRVCREVDGGGMEGWIVSATGRGTL